MNADKTNLENDKNSLLDQLKERCEQIKESNTNLTKLEESISQFKAEIVRKLFQKFLKFFIIKISYFFHSYIEQS